MKLKNISQYKLLKSGIDNHTLDSLKKNKNITSKSVSDIQKSSHKARKNYISTLLDAGTNLNTVRESVGHCDEKTTLNCYYFDRSTEENKIKQFEDALAI